jgi:phosphoglycolate phosphatase
MTNARTLILWDLDGTLLSAGPAASDAFDEAVAAVVGRSPGSHGVRMSGKTDPQIALEILATMAIEEPEARRHLPGVLRALEGQLEGAVERMRTDGRALPGVTDVLALLGRRPDVLQSVLTGNLEANASVKLRVFGLDRWLDLEVGAFGSDSPDRTELVAVALDKVERVHRLRVQPEDVWVVGDTPLDLACARAGGARCLLVATGRYGVEDLRGVGADDVLPDLADADRVVRVLAGPPAGSDRR